MVSTYPLMKEEKISSWIPTKRSDFFTSDQLIDAYLHGKRDAFAATQRLAVDKLSNNIEKSGDISINLLKTLSANHFTPINAYLRVNDLDNFDIMVTVPEDDIISDEFLNMYDIVSKMEAKNKEEYYDVFISFCPVNEHFEEINVSSDGYLLKLAQNGE